MHMTNVFYTQLTEPYGFHFFSFAVDVVRGAYAVGGLSVVVRSSVRASVNISF